MPAARIQRQSTVQGVAQSKEAKPRFMCAGSRVYTRPAVHSLRGMPHADSDHCSFDGRHAKSSRVRQATAYHRIRTARFSSYVECNRPWHATSPNYIEAVQHFSILFGKCGTHEQTENTQNSIRQHTTILQSESGYIEASQNKRA